MRPALKLFLSLTLALLSLSCAAPRITLSESQIQERIVGTWAERFHRGRFEFLEVKTFSPDGSAHGWIQAIGSNGSVTMHFPRIKFQDRWRVKGDVIETYDIRCDDPTLFPAGTVLHDRLLRLTDQSAHFIDLDHHNQRYVMHRLKDGETEVPPPNR